MGYSKSKKVVEDLRTILLEPLVKADGDVRVPTRVPDELAYKYRNALYVIARNPASFKEFTELGGRYKVTSGGDCLIFRKSIRLIEGAPERITPDGIGAAQSLTIPEVTTAMQVVGAVIKHKADEMIFPMVEASAELLHDVAKWTSKNGYVITSNSPFTLMRKQDA